MANVSWGYQTYKARHFVATIRYADGSCKAEIETTGSRKQAFVMIAGRNKGAKVESLFEVEDTDTESLERFGFVEARCYPSRNPLGDDIARD